MFCSEPAKYYHSPHPPWGGWLTTASVSRDGILVQKSYSCVEGGSRALSPKPQSKYPEHSLEFLV